MNLKEKFLSGGIYALAGYTYTISFESITKVVIALLTIAALFFQVRREINLYRKERRTSNGPDNN